MNRDALRSEMERVFSECLSIMDSKNKDYAKDVDPFANLRTCEILGITNTEIGMLVRMTDKFSRICNLVYKEPDVVDETIEDTIKDLINYLSLLLVYMKDKSNNKDVKRCVVCGKELTNRDLFYGNAYSLMYGSPPGIVYVCTTCEFSRDEELNQHDDDHGA